MKKPISIYLLIITLIFTAFPISAASPIMTITAFDYGSDTVNSGDSVLLESKGKYLLMDTMNYDKTKKIINTLKKKKIKKLSLYLSHWHEDHFYYLWYILNDSYFTVEHIYLPPAAWLVRCGNSSNDGKLWYKYSRRCYEGISANGKNVKGLYGAHQIVAKAREKRIPTTFLKKGNSFNIGNATVKVIWYGTNTKLVNTDASFFTHGNNLSLVTKVTAGGMSYLTAGDIGSEIYELMKKNKINISADLMKLSHHGSSETAEIVKRVSPKCAFFSNCNDSPTATTWNTKQSSIAKVTKLLSVRRNGDITFKFFPKGSTYRMSVQSQKRLTTPIKYK